MRFLSASLLALGLSSFKAVAEITTLTLDEVDSQIASYLQGLENGTLSERSIESPTGCTLACGFLNFILPGQISYPNSPIYEFLKSQYWSVQQYDASPVCRFSPTSAASVSVGVLAARVSQCQFAAKSGGHAAFYGASNINGGITFDLAKLNQVTVSANKKQVSLGPGNVWYDVYSTLTPMGLSVIGGRVAAIGVGGLTLGGGISFFSARYGWACDNVNNYQVVFADGTIRDVNYASYPDLYFALRGGGNNFGIVTRFDVVAFPQGDMWGGSDTYLYDAATAAALNTAFENVNVNIPSDPYASVILAYGYAQSIGQYAISSILEYGKPVANPPILANFTAVPGAIASTLRITNLPDLTVELNNSNPGGFRESYWTLMVKNGAALMTDLVEIFMEETDAIKDASGILPSYVFQPISTAMTSQFSKNGGNALGISAADGPLVLINISISWLSASDDARILRAARNMVDRSNAAAYAAGLGYPFLYENYAALEQKVFQSYGEKNLQKLRAVSKKYDPAGVWQKLQPGYFKLGL
ncbi:FAD binding domain-containing protein [Phlyctema vagabunda]|uniref:FAD binding domain-containing protein n=1 Tax=Phlyctema vagabunda TaxID=108571 RepID=A0ABR4P7V1_9HELO